MSGIADLPAIASLPGHHLLAHSARLRGAFARAQPMLFVGRAMHRLAKADRLFPALRTWALMMAEVGCARLPGGSLLDGDELAIGLNLRPGGGDAHAHSCGCGDAASHRDEAWMRALDDTVRLTAARDGPALFDVWAHVLASPSVSGDASRSYVASLASSALDACTTAGIDRTHEAMLHVLGWHARSAVGWSAACTMYRVSAAALALRDMGSAMGGEVYVPEMMALARLPAELRAAALSVIGPAYAEIVSDDPDEPLTADMIDVVNLGDQDGPGEPGGPLTADAGALAVEFTMAYRRRDMAEVQALGVRAGNTGVAMAALMISNMFAMRMRELYG